MEDKNLEILVLIPAGQKHKELLESAAPGAHFEYATPASVDAQAVQAADIIIGNPPAELVRGSQKLRWMQLNSAGADAYLPQGVLPAGTLLTNATGAYGLAISEHMMGMTLSLYKKLYLYRDNQRSGIWKDEGKVPSIYGSTVLIVGLGDIGGEYARRMRAFGAYVIGVRRKDTQKPDYADELHLTEELDTLLPRADIVALCLPGTAQTKGLMDERRLHLMKQGSILINIGRGSAVDTNALYDALDTGHLAGAAIDVTDPEPLPQGHKLWSVKNLIITPHVSGGFHLQETFERIVHIAARNLKHFLDGETLENQVDFSTGYRKL